MYHKNSNNFDEEYLQALASMFNEWESEYDEEAYKNLQNIVELQ